MRTVLEIRREFDVLSAPAYASVNPRGSPVAGQGVPGGSNNAHRIIRRGLPYGPTYDSTKPYDGIERGMLFHFINSNIENQYEFVLRRWVNDSEFAGAVRLHSKVKGSAHRHAGPRNEHLRNPSVRRSPADRGDRLRELYYDQSGGIRVPAEHHSHSSDRQTWDKRADCAAKCVGQTHEGGSDDDDSRTPER